MVRVYALITLGGKGLCTYNSWWWVYALITLGGKGLCAYNSRGGFMYL